MSKLPILFVALAACAQAAVAQVGHDPSRSPYRDIPVRTNLVALGGLLGGNGGGLSLGPSDGGLTGARIETVLSGPSDGFFEIVLARPRRVVIDPESSVATRVTGPLRQSLVMVDVGLTILLTGEKTWRGFSPYVGGSLGLAIGGGVDADSSAYRFNTKFTTGPHIGVRWYPSRFLSLRIEGRLLFWQLKYPDSFFVSPVLAPGDPPVLDPDSAGSAEWTAQPTLMIGLGYALRF